jgi:hypothetical protein
MKISNNKFNPQSCTIDISDAIMENLVGETRLDREHVIEELIPEIESFVLKINERIEKEF